MAIFDSCRTRQMFSLDGLFQLILTHRQLCSCLLTLFLLTCLQKDRTRGRFDFLFSLFPNARIETLSQNHPQSLNFRDQRYKKLLQSLPERRIETWIAILSGRWLDDVAQFSLVVSDFRFEAFRFGAPAGHLPSCRLLARFPQKYIPRIGSKGTVDQELRMRRRCSLF